VRTTGGRKSVPALRVEKVSDLLFRPAAVWGNCAGTCATDYDYDDLDRLDDVEYLSNQLDVEGFVMHRLGNRTSGQVLRCNERVSCTAESLVVGKNEGRKKTGHLRFSQGE